MSQTGAINVQAAVHADGGEEALAGSGELPCIDAEVQIACAGESYPGERVVSRVGQLTRQLHESLRALGYDKALESAASQIPDARDRLGYVAEMTERAAERALTATEVARPIQERLAADASGLSQRWQKLFDRELSIEHFKMLVEDTRSFLAAVPERSSETNAQLLEIMMAQDFQDLTGQMIKRIAEVTHSLEAQLVQLLVDCVPQDKRDHGSGLTNGPVVDPGVRTDVVTDQSQVDDLLESLGF